MTKSTKPTTHETKICNNTIPIQIHTTFTKPQIKTLLTEYQTCLGQLDSLGTIGDDIKKDTTFILYTLMLRNFTNIDDIPLDVMTIASIQKELLERNIYDDIFAHFPVDQYASIGREVKLMVKRNVRLSKKLSSELELQALQSEQLSEQLSVI